jgi:PAS domain-containing protein
VEKRASPEAGLRESEERFRLAFEHAPIGKALIGLDGRYEQVNRAMCELTGYTETELRARTDAAITHPDDLAAGRRSGRRGPLAFGGNDALHARKALPDGHRRCGLDGPVGGADTG